MASLRAVLRLCGESYVVIPGAKEDTISLKFLILNSYLPAGRLKQKLISEFFKHLKFKHLKLFQN